MSKEVRNLITFLYHEKSTIVLLLTSLVIITFLQSREISDFDIFWQIKLGQLMLEQGHLITSEPFSYTHFGETIPSLGWLAQLIFAIIFNIGSWSAVQGFHVTLMTAAYLTVAWSSMREGMNGFCVFSAVVIGFLVGLSNSTVRPQSFALCCFALLLVALRKDMKISLKLLGLIPVLLIWQNTHPSLAMGFVLTSAIAATAWVRWFLASEKVKPWGITMVWFMVVTAQIATPIGTDIFTISRINFDIVHDLGIDEWLHPWDKKVIRSMLFFWLALEISLFLLLRLKAKIKFTELSVFLVMTGLTLMSCRFALFWGLAMIPIWARWINLLKPRHLFQWLDLNQNIHHPIPTSIFSIGFLAIFPVCWIFGPVTLASRIPMDGIHHLEQILPKGRIYNCREFGGPLILSGSPNWKIAIDGRLYLYPKRDWNEYFNMALGKLPLNIIIEKHNPDAFFLHPVYNRGLIKLLHQSSDWQKVYSDATCITFIKKMNACSINNNSLFMKEQKNADLYI